LGSFTLDQTDRLEISGGARMKLRSKPGFL